MPMYLRLSSSAAVLLLTVAAWPAAAQSATTQTPAKPGASEVAFSGCLTQQATVTGAPVGHESGAAAGVIITKATATSRVDGGAAPPTKPGASYLIAGTRAQELSRYVGEIVEVTGTLDTDAASEAGRAPTTAAASPKPIAQHTLTVATFRPTGSKCQ